MEELNKIDILRKLAFNKKLNDGQRWAASRAAYELDNPVDPEKERLRKKLEIARWALGVAKNRFLDPKFGCIWEDAAEDIDQTLSETGGK